MYLRMLKCHFLLSPTCFYALLTTVLHSRKNSANCEYQQEKDKIRHEKKFSFCNTIKKDVDQPAVG